MEYWYLELVLSVDFFNPVQPFVLTTAQKSFCIKQRRLDTLDTTPSCILAMGRDKSTSIETIIKLFLKYFVYDLLTNHNVLTWYSTNIH
mmetsp:Transcript_83561/g.169562  ORF Transcript_83561/g.169562 Transcript_83561/m.169562 type:complete len:89 (+) Transcript_83561:95-361(+)